MFSLPIRLGWEISHIDPQVVQYYVDITTATFTTFVIVFDGQSQRFFVDWIEEIRKNILISHWLSKT